VNVIYDFFLSFRPQSQVYPLGVAGTFLEFRDLLRAFDSSYVDRTHVLF